MIPILAIISHPAYILATVLVGIAGWRRRGGFFGFTLISLLLTPLVGLFILYFGAEARNRSDV